MNAYDNELVGQKALELWDFCRSRQWLGYDPYDALKSRVFKATPLSKVRLARLAWTQGIKRCPLNLRPFLLIPKDANPKGLALFLSAITRFIRAGLFETGKEIRSLADLLLVRRSLSGRYSAWGYDFDWQTRNVLVPAYTPNVICSTFAGNALLDAYQLLPEPSWLETSVRTASYISEVLFWRRKVTPPCISYTPLWKSEIHNANLLGAAYLCRVGKTVGKICFLERGLDAARYSVNKQHDDGSWPYGEAPNQGWIDNFHTGFNLVALKRIGDCVQTNEFRSSIQKGLDFFSSRFFLSNGAPKYYHDATYPLDIHSVAQSIITLVTLKDYRSDNLDLAQSVLRWGLANMWNPAGYFYFQKWPWFTNRIPFMRWSQAWMALAFSYLLENSRGQRTS
jgi:hypothetical protein